MTKYIFVGLGIGLAGFLVILLAVIVINPKNSNTSQNPVQVDKPAVLGTKQENIPTPTQFIYNSPTPEVAKTYKYGEKVALKDGRYITVYKPINDYKDEGSFITAPEGKKFVLVEAEYENTGSKKTACYVTLRLGDIKDVFYDNYPSIKSPGVDCRDHEDQSYLQPGKSTRGFTTFQVNADTTISKILYQDYEHNEKITFSEN